MAITEREEDAPPVPSNVDLRTFLVCGMTGVGKSTFINKVTGAKLSISHGTDSDTTDVIERGIPLIKHGDKYIQLVDTPGFGDSRETSETVILRRITTWLVARHMSKVPVAGVLFFRPIHDVRVNRLEKALIHMFKDLCGKNCHDHIILVTTRWPSNPTEANKALEGELASREDYFGLDGKEVQTRRLKDNYTIEEARDLVRSFAGLSPVTFQIQREVVEEKMTLGETEAGQRIGADLEEKLVDLEEKAMKAHEYAATAIKRLKEAEEAKARMEKEKIEAARKAKEAAEAARAAELEAQAAKERSEKELAEAEERARRAKEAAEAAQAKAREAEAEKKRLADEAEEAERRAKRAKEREETAKAEKAELAKKIQDLSKPVKKGFWGWVWTGLVAAVTLGTVILD